MTEAVQIINSSQNSTDISAITYRDSENYLAN